MKKSDMISNKSNNMLLSNTALMNNHMLLTGTVKDARIQIHYLISTNTIVRIVIKDMSMIETLTVVRSCIKLLTWR